jgi:hypothetical protein
MVMEQLHATHTRMDEHAKTLLELHRRDALRDHPVDIHNGSSTTPIATPYRNNRDLLPAPQREQTPYGSNNRRFIIDPKFVAHTVDHATAFDGDSFSRSIRMDAPFMPRTGDSKFWKLDFMSFLSLKAAALIPQLAMSSSSVPINPIAQRYTVRTRYALAVPSTQQIGRPYYCGRFCRPRMSTLRVITFPLLHGSSSCFPVFS